jgi:hypothetical protein
LPYFAPALLFEAEERERVRKDSKRVDAKRKCVGEK